MISMNDNFPISITNEADLDFYQNFLNKNFEKPIQNTFSEKLRAHLQSPVKIDCVIGNRLDTKFGRLLDVGEDFILIKHPQSNQKMLIPTSAVRFVTITK